jgi:hypothetical protein
VNFLASLSFQDLKRLREVVKRVHMKSYPPNTYTDRQADAMIEAFGPVYCERLIVQSVDQRNLTKSEYFEA